MALLTTTSNVAVNISKTESVLIGSGATVTLTAANTFRVTVEANTLGGPLYGLNLRIGTTGGLTDAILFSSNNIQTNTTVLNGLNNLANANPQFTGLDPVYVTNYLLPTPTGPATPALASGELLISVGSVVAGNANVTVSNPSPSDNGLFSKLGTGVIAQGNVASGSPVYINLTGQVGAYSNVLSYVGTNGNTANPTGLSANAIFGPTPGGNSWNLVTTTVATSNGFMTVGMFEQLH
jgi:hypothetical protein